METSEVRQRVLAALGRAKQRAAERRTRNDAASREFESLLRNTAVPLFRQLAGVLKAEGFNFTVFTPEGSVRLMSDRSSKDYVELLLDTAGERPLVIGHSSRTRGGRVVESEREVGSAVSEISEDDLLRFTLDEVESIVVGR
jgi:hypothetical protein